MDSFSLNDLGPGYGQIVAISVDLEIIMDQFQVDFYQQDNNNRILFEVEIETNAPSLFQYPLVADG